MLEEIDEALDNPEPNDRSYLELAERAKGEPPASYRWSDRHQRRFTAKQVERLRRLASKWTEPRFAKFQFREGRVPRPRPVLRITPSL